MLPQERIEDQRSGQVVVLGQLLGRHIRGGLHFNVGGVAAAAANRWCFVLSPPPPPLPEMLGCCVCV